MRRLSYSVFSPLLVAFAWLLASAPALAHQPHDPMFVVATSPNFAQDQTVMIATDYLTVSIGVYLPLKSIDGGNTWIPVRGLPNVPVNAIEYSPNFSRDGVMLLAGKGGLYRSSDRGNTWTQTAALGNVLSVAFSPNFAADATAFTITSNALYRSQNGGVTFSPIATPGPLIGGLNEIAVSPAFSTDKTIVVGASPDGLFRSTDAGATWSVVLASGSFPNVTGLAFSPGYATDHTAFASTFGSGVYITTDSASHWSQINSGITDLQATSLKIYPGFVSNGTVLVSSANAGVFITGNRGQSWTKAAGIFRNLSFQSNIHFRSLSSQKTSDNSATIFLAMFEGLWKSTNRGASWSYIDTIPPYEARVLALTTTYARDQTVFYSSYGSGAVLSTNGGQTWSFRDGGLDNAYPDGTAISPNYSHDGIVFAGIFSGLDRAVNGGSWALMPALGAPSYVRAVGVSPGFAQDNTVFIGTDNRDTPNPLSVTYQGQNYPNQGLFYSTDAGAHWIPTGLGGPPINTIAVSPNFVADRTVYASSSENGLYQSVDGGLTFNLVFTLPNDSGVLQIAVSPTYSADHTVFAGTTHSGIYKSTDSGANWTKLPGSDLLTALALALSPNYLSDQTVFLGTFQSGLLKSVDGGNNFVPTGLTQNFVNSIVVSPAFATDQTVFAAAYSGIYKSANGGATWRFTANPGRQDSGRFVTVLLNAAWSTVNDNKASVSSYASTSTPGAIATVNFVGSGIRMVALTNSQQGSASVLLDGVLDATVSLNSATPQYQQSVYQKAGITCGAHSLQVVASSVPSQAKINIDAFDILRDGCPN